MVNKRNAQGEYQSAPGRVDFANFPHLSVFFSWKVGHTPSCGHVTSQAPCLWSTWLPAWYMIFPREYYTLDRKSHGFLGLLPGVTWFPVKYALLTASSAIDLWGWVHNILLVSWLEVNVNACCNTRLEKFLFLRCIAQINLYALPVAKQCKQNIVNQA